jgi:hypothetical protein
MCSAHQHTLHRKGGEAGVAATERRRREISQKYENYFASCVQASEIYFHFCVLRP